MKNYKNYFNDESESSQIVNFGSKSEMDENGFYHISITTYIFKEAHTNLLVTNSMFSSLLNDIYYSIDPYPINAKIELDLFETHNIDDLSVHTVTLGFKRYVFSCLKGLIARCKAKFLLFTSFFFVGLGIEVILYVLLNGLIPMWLFKSLEVLGNLFIWQFGGYIVFDFFPERKKIKRYKQILKSKISVKHWD